MLHILSHVYSRFSVYDIPNNCFSISPSTRYPLKVAYKMLSKQQEVLKALFLHAKLNIPNFDLNIESQAKDLLKPSFTPLTFKYQPFKISLRKSDPLLFPVFYP